MAAAVAPGLAATPGLFERLSGAGADPSTKWM